MSSAKQNIIFKTIGEFLFKEFYYSVYNRASTTLTGDQSVTQNYVLILSRYIVCITDDIKCYKVFLESLFKFAVDKLNLTYPFSTFLDKLSENFFPSKYDYLFAKEQRDEILTVVITDIVSKIGRQISKPTYLKYIIDDRSTQRNVVEEMIRNETVSILELKKLEYSNKFISKISKGVDTDMEFLRQKNEELHKENEQLKNAMQEYKSLESEIYNMRIREGKYKQMIYTLHDIKTKLEDRLQNQQEVVYVERRIPTPSVASRTVSAPVYVPSVAPSRTAPAPLYVPSVVPAPAPSVVSTSNQIQFEPINIQALINTSSFQTSMKQSNALTEVNINKIEEKNKVDIVNSFITNTLPQKNITFDDDEPIINEEHELNLDIDADLSD